MIRKLNITHLFFFYILLLTLVSCKQETSGHTKITAHNELEDLSAIRGLYSEWSKAVESGNRQKYVDLLDENIVLIAPGASDIVGKENYANFLAPVFDNATYKIEPLGGHDIELLGDYALVRYDYIIRVTIKQGVTAIKGSEAALTEMKNNSKYLDVLKRQETGEWKVFRHMWNEGKKND